MSSYTTELRFICEYYAGEQGSNYSRIINNSWDKIFNFDFPIFDENYRELLCKKIIKHYYTREISEETHGLWKLRLDTRMNEIMPYYNKLYKIWLDDVNPFNNVDLKTTHTLSRDKNTNGEQNTETNTETQTVEKFSDTPQGALDNVTNGTYLTNATITDVTQNTKGNTKAETTEKTTDEYIENIIGKNSRETYIELYTKYKKALLNIDMLVIKDLEKLFLLIW